MEEKKTPIKLIWLGFIGAIIAYVAVTYLNPVSPQPAGDVMSSNNTYYIFLFLSLVLIAAAHLFWPRILPPTNPDGSWNDGRFNSLRLLQFAFSESPAIFGLVIYFATGNQTRFFIFVFISALSLVLLYPRKETA